MNIEGFYFYRVVNVNVKIKKTSTNKKRSNLFFSSFYDLQQDEVYQKHVSTEIFDNADKKISKFSSYLK